MNWFDIDPGEREIDQNVDFFLREVRRKEEEEAKKNTLEAALQWLAEIKYFIYRETKKSDETNS
jgi:hypothetical protein